MTTSFGIDFGTTNSVLAVSRDGEVDIVNINSSEISEKTLKSVLFFDEEKNISVGQEAIDQYLSYGCMYGRFLQSIKTFLPNRSFKETQIFGKRFELEDLVALILKEIKHRGELHVGHTVNTVVIGRPVVFSENKDDDLLAEERLRSAALRAGFINIHFLYEPVAATLSYENTLLEGEEKLVFMGDFGGGTSDFVVMRLRGGMRDPRESRKKDILSVGGVYVGGDSFDSVIMWNKVAKYFGKDTKHKSSTGQLLDMPLSISRTLCQKHLLTQLRSKWTLEVIRSIKVTADDRSLVQNLEDLVIKNLGHAVFQSIEKAKCELSASDTSSIDFSEKSIMINETVTRAEFESFAVDEINRIKLCVDSVLMQAGVSANDIDIALITGGSSFIPAIRKIFADKFGEQKIKPVDAFTSVAYGLGLSASMY